MNRLFCKKGCSQLLRMVLACSVLLCGAAGGAWGTTYYWVGGTADTSGNYNWTEGKNWSTTDGGTANTDSNAYPGYSSNAGSDVAYFTGRAAASVTIDAAVTVSQINFNTEKTSTITLTFGTYDLTVSGSLTNFGTSGGTIASAVTIIGNGVSSDDTTNGSGQLILAGGFDDAEKTAN